MKVKGLLEALDLSQEQVNALHEMKVATAMQRIMFFSKIISKGGTVHRPPNRETIQKRREKNKAARKARRVNR